MFSELKKFSWPTIGLICIFSVVLVGQILPLLPRILWPGGIGIGKDDSVATKTVETIEKDKQGKTLKKVTTTAHNDGKTLWDWLSLLGVPLSLAILGYILQEQQRKRADNETKEEVLQTYFDRLSVLLIDRNLIALSKKSHSPKITPEEQELLDSALDVIRARTLSILRRFENDAERKTSVIRFLIETEIISESKLNLSGADLSGADLSGANLQGANLQGAILQEANLQGANPIEANLIKANPIEANLIKANLIKANLQQANLQQAKLQQANLIKANLIKANLIKANLQQANLEGANSIEAGFQEAEFQGAKLKGAILKKAEFQQAKLQGANLEGAKLQGANLERANLGWADLRWANLRWANLEGANLEGADLKGIKWNSNTIWPDKSKFTDAENISKGLKKKLGITP
jgi:hypothetical protein